MAKCCSNIFLNGLTQEPPNIIPPVEPIYNIYYTTLNVVDPFSDNLTAGVYGSMGGFNIQQIVGNMQTQITPDSGGGVDTFFTVFRIWIKSEGEPVGWTWNGTPIEWVDNGLAVLNSCQTTGLVLIDTTVWSLRYFYLLVDYQEIHGGSLAYNSPTFDAEFLTECIKEYGGNVTVATDIRPDSIELTIYNTYITNISLGSEDFVNPTIFTDLIPCP